MSNRCRECPLRACQLLALSPDGSGCRSFLALRASLPETPSRPPPPPAATPARPIRPLADTLALLKLIHACPHFTPKAEGDPCGCMGRCKAGRGDMREGRTSYRNCEGCRAGELEASEAPV